MDQIHYSLEQNVALVVIPPAKNRFNPDFLDEMIGVLDDVERKTDASALVITSSHEKIFSDGIDLEWFIPTLESGRIDSIKQFFHKLNEFLKRILGYPLLIVAAMNGHTFAAGTVLACACDFRFIRNDRGFFCLPEIDVGLPLLPSAISICRKAIPLHMFEEMQFTGRRLTGPECRDHKIVTKACPPHELIDTALDFAKGLNKKRAIVQEMKKRSNSPILRIIEEEDPLYIEKTVFKL